MPYKRGQKWVAQARKQKLRKEKIFDTKKEALEWETEQRKLSIEDWNKKTDTVCLLDWATMYLDYAKTKFCTKTYDEKRSMFRRFLKFVDPGLSVLELTLAKVLAFISKQDEERSGYAANKDRKNLVAAWNWGMKYLEPPLPQPNPCMVERMPEERHPRYIPPEEDFWRVYDVAKGQDKVMLLALLHLAARRGEIFRLTVSDLDFENNRVRLWTRKRIGGNLEYDWLPMTKELKRAFLWWLEERPFKEAEHVFVCLDESSFCQEYYGKPFRKRRHFMNRLCKKAGVEPFGFHAIRHLSASALYRMGYELAAIQTILRHRSPNTTERYLKSLGLEKVREALESLSRKDGKVLQFKGRRGEAPKPQNKKPSEEPSPPQTAKQKLGPVG